MQKYYNSILGGPGAIDWCEPNYIVSPYVAEWFNFVSSIIMALPAVYGLVWKYRQGRELRYLLVDIGIIVISLGSALFHGTLTRYGQMMDELPMLWGALIFTSVVWHSRLPKSDVIFLGALLLFSFAWTCFGQFIHHSHNWIFETVFGGIVLFALYLMAKLIMSSPCPHSTPLLIAYVILGVGSFLLWNLDQWFCPQLTPLYIASPYFTSLHGYWHIGMGLQCYVGSLMSVLLRHEYLHGGKAVVSWSILPIVNPPSTKKE